MKEHKINEIANQLAEKIKSDSRSDSEISRISGVSQPTVSRLRTSKGGRTRITDQFIKLCICYGIPIDAIKSGRGFDELLCDAIIDVWDGTEMHARALLLLMQGIKDLDRSAHQHARRVK